MDKGYEIALQRIEECIKEGRKSLNLAGLGLTALPDSICELGFIEELNLGNEDYVENITEEVEMVLGGEKKNVWRYKPRNHVGKNVFTTLPKQITNLKNLKHLDLTCTCLENLGSIQNESILDIDLRGNNLTDLKGIEGFTNLECLNASNNEIENIENVFLLKNIRELYLGSNKIKDINCLSSLGRLNKLFLSQNAIANIDPIGELYLLEVLNLSKNDIKGSLSSLIRLKNLKYLDISNNSISSLEGIENCENLKDLIATGNQIKDVTILRNCRMASRLQLNQNQIETFDILDSLPNLECLSLSKNKLSTIPAGIINHPKINVLELGWNSALEKIIPVEIINVNEDYDDEYDTISGTFLMITPGTPHWRYDIDGVPIDDYFNNCKDHLISWLKDHESSSVINNSVRVILCGNARVGKSSILDILQGRGFKADRKSTHAIEIEKLLIPNLPEPLECWVWDLGGQEVYHTTHQIFMRGKAIFLVAWDKETEDSIDIEDPLDTSTRHPNYRLRYWLHTIRSISPESPIILVQNKTDIHGWATPHSDQISTDFKVKYYASVSAQTQEGIDILKRYICEAAREILEYRMSVPASWWRMRDNILELKAKGQTNIISWDYFTAMCLESGVPPASIEPLSSFFKSTSLCYYLTTNEKKNVILNQRWAIEAIYKIFDRESRLYKNLKKYPWFSLSEIMDAGGTQYTQEEKGIFLGFMEDIQL